MNFHGFFAKFTIFIFCLPISSLFCSVIFASDSSSNNEILRSQWNLVRWHEPVILYGYLSEAKITQEGKRWCDEVESLISELAVCYPTIEKAAEEGNETLESRNEEAESIKIESTPVPEKKAFSENEITAFLEDEEDEEDEKDERDENIIPTLAKNTVLTWNFQDQTIRRQRDAVLRKLTQKTQEVPIILARTQDISFITRLGRANFALQRRLTVWRYADAIMAQSPETPVQNISQAVDPRNWETLLGMLQQIIRNHPYAETWANYIRYDQLNKIFSLNDIQKQREIAQSVLIRLDAARLNQPQRVFLAQTPFQNLVGELRKIATLRSSKDYLLYSLEEYESAAQISEGNHIAAECLRGWFLRKPGQEDFLQHLEYSYRNANIRLEISNRFLNRLIPQRAPEVMTINEYVVNRPVYGRGVTNTNIRIQMIPDSQRFRLGFTVNGRMESSTVSEASMVRVSNDSEADFYGVKEVELTEQGIHTVPAVAQVSNQVRMRNLQTSLDVIPLFGSLAKEMARNQATTQQELARQETQQRIHRQVTGSLNEEVNLRIEEVNTLWREKVQGPLGRLGIDFRQIDAETNEDAATVRWRLAGADQLGGHTPRPLAAPHNLLNFQIHESAINNFLQQLKLEGKTFTIAQLHEHIALRFPKWREKEMDPDVPQNLVIVFPPTDAISVKMAEGQIMLQLSIARLQIGEHEWENFKIHVPYRVETQGFQAMVRRDGVVRLIGKMKLPQQIAVRGVFSKAFPKDAIMYVIPERILQDPRYSIFTISQCVMQDGWIGISVSENSGPVRTVMQENQGILR